MITLLSRATAAFVLLTGTAVAVPTAAGAAPTSVAGEGCGVGAVCFWSEPYFEGLIWEWRSEWGHRNMPPYLHDHVGSYVAKARACLVDYKPESVREIGPDGSNYAYLKDFGNRVDAIYAGTCNGAHPRHAEVGP